MSDQEKMLALHDLPKPHRADHSEDIGEPHTSAKLEEWFNSYHKCRNCHKVIRTYDQLYYMPCKAKAAP